MRNLAAAALLLLAAACSRGTSDAAPGAGTTGAAGAVAPAPAEPGFVVAIVQLRKTPDLADKIPGPDGKTRVSNYLPIALYRGERVTILEVKDDWTRVLTSDDKEGWTRSSTVLDGNGVTEATLLAEANVFDRPDLLAANAKRMLPPGSLLFVVKSKPPFSEVNVPGGPNAWVLTERLATGEREVAVAKLIEKARWLVKKERKDEAAQLLELARSQFGDVVLVPVLEAELNPAPDEGAPAEGGAAPPAGQ